MHQPNKCHSPRGTDNHRQECIRTVQEANKCDSPRGGNKYRTSGIPFFLSSCAQKVGLTLFSVPYIDHIHHIPHTTYPHTPYTIHIHPAHSILLMLHELLPAIFSYSLSCPLFRFLCSVRIYSHSTVPKKHKNESENEYKNAAPRLSHQTYSTYLVCTYIEYKYLSYS